MKPSEAWLQYVWQNGILKPGLMTLDGRLVSVSGRGTINHDAGPDFLNAVIRIGEEVWAGHVEIHLRSSDWVRHGHHLDPAYDNVVLHAVLDHDEEVATSQGELLPTLELRKYLYPDSWKRYLTMLGRRKSVPCQPYLHQVGDLHFMKALETMAAERLWQKVAMLGSDYRLSGLEPDQLAYQSLGRTMGFHVNSGAFQVLCKALPYPLIRKHIGQGVRVEALLFGMSGMLTDPVTPHAASLLGEWDHLCRRHRLFPLGRKLWKYARTRQSNNPELRIAQFAALLNDLVPLFDTLCNLPLAELRDRLQPLMGRFWQGHDQLNGRESRVSRLSPQSIDAILINTVLPLRLFAEEYLGRGATGPEILELLSAMPPEDNRVSRMWSANGKGADSALGTQGQLQLFLQYCRKKRCLECPVSVRILGGAG